MYSVDGVMGLLGQHPIEKRSYIYARVSSAKQQGDLDRQIEDLQKAYPGYTLIQDIGSGVNFKRKGLQTILGHALTGMVGEVAIMHRDRLARIGYDLLEFIFTKTSAKLVVHGTDEADADGKHDLADDLLAVTTLFVASHNGRRAAENRKRRREGKAISNGEEEAKDARGRRRKAKQQQEE
jgi:predicted site-specific integrase-resolvase